MTWWRASLVGPLGRGATCLRSFRRWTHTSTEEAYASGTNQVARHGLLIRHVPARRRRRQVAVLPSLRLSKTKLKARQPPPSAALVAALQELKLRDAIPASRRHRPDLSYGEPTSRRGRLRTRIALRRLPVYHLKELAPTLPGILARYLTCLHGALSSVRDAQDATVTLDDEAILNVFPESVMTLLESKGYGPEDLVTWAWIFAAPDAERATTRLSMAMISRSARGSRPTVVPTFVFMSLLRRRHINAKTLRLLLIYAENRLRGPRPGLRPDMSPGRGPAAVNLELRLSMLRETARLNLSKMDEKTIVVMVIRLLRHARRVWPQAMVNIADMITGFVDGGIVPVRQGRLRSEKVARLTFIYNRMLSLVSLPSPMGPFRMVPYHQRAQLNLIGRMAAFEPPLPVTEEGYRAVVKIQLAHMKTDRERRWGDGQAKSWPPWKEERLGIETDEGSEEGVSRAAETLARMREAGYPGGRWERAASILAGWDTDQSPTIQTRAILRRGPPGWRRSRLRLAPAPAPPSPDAEDDDPSVWAARITATRTVQEAWACFLVCDDRGVPFTREIYEAMFPKLVFERKRTTKKSPSERRCLDPGPTRGGRPGDGKEVFAAPLSPSEGVYVRSEPPELSDLFDRMIKEGTRPSERCLAFLVSHADSSALALHFLRSSGLLANESLHALTDLRWDAMHDDSAKLLLREIPEPIFEAYVKLLCRLPTPVLCGLSAEQPRYPLAAWGQVTAQSLNSVGDSPLRQVFRLVYTRQSTRRPAWNALMAALARRFVRVARRYSPEQSPPWHDLMTWRLLCKIMSQMDALGLEVDVQSFRILCVGLQKAVVACRELKRRPPPKDEECLTLPYWYTRLEQGSPQRVRLQSQAQEILDESPRYIKSVFATLVGLRAAPDERPNALTEHISAGPADDLPVEIPASLPPLLHVPGPTQIHSFIRALGLLGDHHGLVSLVHWMSVFEFDLDAAVQELSNGEKAQRRCLIALRMFLEGTWVDGQDDDGASSDEAARAPEELITRARDIVNRIDHWNGWPEDHQIDAYRQTGRFSPSGGI